MVVGVAVAVHLVEEVQAVIGKKNIKSQRSTPKFLRGILSDEDFTRVAERIGQVEKKTSGEVRISIREKRDRKEKELDLFSLAAKEFHRLGMQKTRHATGILLFILFEEKKLQILADAGIYVKVPQSKWDEIARDISSHFKNGKFGDGMCCGIDEMGKLLGEHFPIESDDKNELSDEVSIS